MKIKRRTSLPPRPFVASVKVVKAPTRPAWILETGGYLFAEAFLVNLEVVKTRTHTSRTFEINGKIYQVVETLGNDTYRILQGGKPLETTLVRLTDAPIKKAKP